MIIRKSFQFRLKPTKKQQRLLDEALEECRWLYNEYLRQRISAFEIEMPLAKYGQLMFLPYLKAQRPSLENVHSQVLQNVGDRIDKAFQAFFRRCKSGEKPGFPRFRGLHRYNSFCYPQSGFRVMGNHLKLSKLGNIRIKLHRSIEGEIKTCTLKKNASGDWDVSLSCLVEKEPKAPNDRAIGIDLGLKSFASLSNRETIENPRFFKRGAKALAKAQRQLSKLTKGTPERKKKGKAVAKIHEKIRNQRKDFCHKESRKLVDQYQYILLEDLNIKKMIERSPLAKSIADASWNQFCQNLTYKAEEAGRKVVFVNPAYSSDECSKCHHIEPKNLSDRMHICSKCGYIAPRDFNSADIMLGRGLAALGLAPRSLRL